MVSLPVLAPGPREDHLPAGSAPCVPSPPRGVLGGAVGLGSFPGPGLHGWPESMGFICDVRHPVS